jgi:Na+/proline symporter
VLPRVIANMLPIGLKGMIVGAMVSAGMSTFDSEINSNAATFTKNIYQSYLHPTASPKILILAVRLYAIISVALGLICALVIDDINEIWSWLTMILGSSTMVSYLLRFFWWRLNGYGYAGGMIVGTIVSIILKLVMKTTGFQIGDMYSLLIIISISFIATIAISYLTEPTSTKVLLRYYAKTKPFGLWGPIRKRLVERDQKLQLKDGSSYDSNAPNLTLIWCGNIHLCPLFAGSL